MKKVVSFAVSVLLLATVFALPAQAAITPDDPSYNWERFKGQDVTLNVYNWGLYISDGSDGGLDINKEFEDLTGIKVNYTTYDTNESLYAKLKSGGANYDVIVPSDYMLQKKKSSKTMGRCNNKCRQICYNLCLVRSLATNTFLLLFLLAFTLR